MTVPSFVKRILLTENQIKVQVKVLADKINQFYCQRDGVVICIGILTGGIMFMMDLLRRVNFNCQSFFLKVESYSGTQPVKKPIIVHNLIPADAQIDGNDVLIIDDIVDSSATAQMLRKFIQTNFKPRSVRIAVFLQKKGKEANAQFVDWVGTTISNVFLVGYNLDYFGFCRFIPYIFEPDVPKLKRFVARIQQQY